MDKLKNILHQILKNTPQYQEKSREFEIFEVWQRAVGERIAKNCWPICLLNDGILLVAGQSSAWLHQMRYLERQILENLRRELKDKRVKGLRFKLEMRPKPD